MDTGTLLALIGIIAAPLFGFAGVWYGNRSSLMETRAQVHAQAQTTAATTATTMSEAFYGRLMSANEKLTEQNDENERRVDELMQQMRDVQAEAQRQNQRIGVMEADNARLQAENESLRKEIDRLVDEVQRERSEKFSLSRQLSDSQADRQTLERRVVELERKVGELQNGSGG